MYRALIAALALALGAGGASEARVHRAPTAHVPRHKAASARPRHHAGIAEIKPLGPTTFRPVKRYKGFSYLEHEVHPEKDQEPAGHAARGGAEQPGGA